MAIGSKLRRIFATRKIKTSSGQVDFNCRASLVLVPEGLSHCGNFEDSELHCLHDLRPVGDPVRALGALI
jgi:hypothetical protein